MFLNLVIHNFVVRRSVLFDENCDCQSILMRVRNVWTCLDELLLEVILKEVDTLMINLDMIVYPKLFFLKVRITYFFLKVQIMIFKIFKLLTGSQTFLEVF